MSFYAAVISRVLTEMGRRKNQTYVQVWTGVKFMDVKEANLSEWLANNPNHQWNNPGYNEFLVEITKEQFEDVRSGKNPLAHDGWANLPRWQQQHDPSGAAQSFGSWVDPTLLTSTWQPDVPIPDDRWLLRVYIGDPTSGGTHVADEQFAQYEGTQNTTGTFHLRYIRLFKPDDTPLNYNPQNPAEFPIGNALYYVDFTNGIGTLEIGTDYSGECIIPSDGSYKHIGPNNETRYCTMVYKRRVYPMDN